jgi:hypothetical protein
MKFVLMSIYCCHNCGHSRFGSPSTGKLLDTPYQLEKFIKHTIPSTGYDRASVFRDPSTQAFGNYWVNARASGCYEIDDMGRCNIIWFASSTVGDLYENGKAGLPEDAVKLVLFSNPQRMHAYPVSSTTVSTGFCSDCGGTIYR